MDANLAVQEGPSSFSSNSSSSAKTTTPDRRVISSKSSEFNSGRRSVVAAGAAFKDRRRFPAGTGVLILCLLAASASGRTFAVASADYLDRSADVAAAAAAAAAAASSSGDFLEPVFGDHVNLLRGTMFYVCQGSCLCGTLNNRGKVIYCYGDLVPRHGELFAEGTEGSGKASSKDLLAAQLGVWTFGIIALLIVLLLIRRSISSLRKHIQKVTDRLPLYHDDDVLSNHSASGAKEGNAPDSVGPPDLFSDDGTLTPENPLTDDSPEHARLGPGGKAVPVEKLKRMRLHRKDYKKGGEALRGKNVTEGYRVKEKDIKRTMK